jgi:NAD-dependent DNA ligase
LNYYRFQFKIFKCKSAIIQPTERKAQVQRSSEDKTMTVSAVGQNDGSSRLNTIIKSTAAGTAAGYAMKYLWPVTEQENDISSRTMINYCRKLTNKAKVQAINSIGVKSKAQDYFVKMIESGDKEAFKEKTFVVTGTLVKYTRDEIKHLIEVNGGKTSESVSKKTSVVIVGDNPGSKYDKAQKLGITIWNEEELEQNLKD